MSKLGLGLAAAGVAGLLHVGLATAHEADASSRFEAAATKLRFKNTEQQESLLKIFYYAGYLEPRRLWADLNCIEGIKDHAAEAFKFIYPALVEAHAD